MPFSLEAGRGALNAESVVRIHNGQLGEECFEQEVVGQLFLAQSISQEAGRHVPRLAKLLCKEFGRVRFPFGPQLFTDNRSRLTRCNR